jgi:hypothetical protein
LKRYRRYTSSTSSTPEEVWKKPQYPDYDHLFGSSLIPPAPAVSYIPFDRPIVLGDLAAEFVELSMLRETLVFSTKCNPTVQFSIYPQKYPELPFVSYPDSPIKPVGEVMPEPALTRAPELDDFLPRRSSSTKRFPWLYWIQCGLAGGIAREKLKAAQAV